MHAEHVKPALSGNAFRFAELPAAYRLQFDLKEFRLEVRLFLVSFRYPVKR